MILTAEKSRLSGRIRIPGSKSHTIRAIAVASLAKGTSYIRNPMISEDALSAAACYRALGAAIDTGQDAVWTVTGTGGTVTPPNKFVNVGNSGTTLRLAAGSAALAPQTAKITLTGDRQIQARPIQPLLDALSDLGAKAVSVNHNACAPIEIRGTLAGGQTSIECFTSQYLSSLLLACPLAKGSSQINVSLLNEADYVQITCD